MISNPRVGTPVIIRYKKSLKSWFPLEGKTGTIAIPCKRRGLRQGPINHGVMVDGQLVVIPCGNLFPAPQLWGPATSTQEPIQGSLFQ